MSRADELRAELEVEELAERFRQAKKDGTATREMKEELRQKRQEWRELRAANPPELSEGDAVVTPEPVTAGVETPSPGGGEEG